MALSQHTTGLLQSMVDEKGQTLRVEIRQNDGYINATLMCQSASKEWSGYFRSKTAKAYLKALERSLQNCRDPLVKTTVTGDNAGRATWVHEQVAVDLARWISPEFAVFVSGLVLRYAKGELTTEESRAAAKEVAAAAAPVEEPARATAPPAALLQWWGKRDEGREANKDTGAHLKALTANAAKGWHFATLNENINYAATGRTTKQLRVEAKIKKTPRDRMQTPNLCLVAYQELMIQEKWRKEVESRQAAGLSPQEALRVAQEVSEDVLTCCKSTKGTQLPLLEFQPPKISQVERALKAKTLTQHWEKVLKRAAMPVLKTLPAPPPRPALPAASAPFEKDDLYD